MNNLHEFLPDYMSTTYYLHVFFALIYIGFSIILTRQAKQELIEIYWLSWVPVVNLWILGKVIKMFRIGSIEFSHAEYRLITSSIVFILTINIPILGFIIGIAYMTLVVSCMVEFAYQITAN